MNTAFVRVDGMDYSKPCPHFKTGYKCLDADKYSNHNNECKAGVWVELIWQGNVNGLVAVVMAISSATSSLCHIQTEFQCNQRVLCSVLTTDRREQAIDALGSSCGAAMNARRHTHY